MGHTEAGNFLARFPRVIRGKVARRGTWARQRYGVRRCVSTGTAKISFDAQDIRYHPGT